MSETNSIKKISDLINSEPSKNFSECFIVCLLVYIRKLIDIKTNKDIYDILYLYCNWIVHHELSHRKSTEYIKKLEDDIEKCTPLSIAENTKALLPIPRGKFYQQIIAFLEDHGIESQKIQKEFSNFALKLVAVLIDFPIKNNDDSYISSFKFTKGDKKRNFNYKIVTKNGLITEGTFLL